MPFGFENSSMYPHVFKNFAHALRFFSKFLGCFLSFSFSPTLFSVFYLLFSSLSLSLGSVSSHTLVILAVPS